MLALLHELQMDRISLVAVLVLRCGKHQHPADAIAAVDDIPVGSGGHTDMKLLDGGHLGKLAKPGDERRTIFFTAGIAQPEIDMMDEHTLIFKTKIGSIHS